MVIWRVQRHASLGSTQDEMRARLHAGDDVHGLVVRAGEQTSGRGRLGRGWQSPRGGSYQTMALRDESGELLSGAVALAVALGIAEALGSRGVTAMVKWPNDLYGTLPGGEVGKLGGVLCEHLRGHLLVGVGLNVRNEVPTGAAATRELEVDEAGELVLAGVSVALSRPVGGPQLAERYRPYDLLRGRSLEVEDSGARFAGIGAGVNAEGGLLVETTEGIRSTVRGRVLAFDTAANG